MREIIVTDLTRFSTDENVCTAGIDVETGECFRPMPYLKGARCKELNIHPGAILKGDLAINQQASNPHIEDAHYSKLEFRGAATGEKFKSILDGSLSNSISIGFGVDFTVGQKHIPIGETANCSIITIKVDPMMLNILEDQFKPGKVKASFSDQSGHSFSYLSITDRGFHDYAKKHQDDGKLDAVKRFIESQEEIYLRIGLSRAFKAPDGRNGYWLQVNGIYTFPHFHKEVRTYE
jgi:hypothetical protein